MSAALADAPVLLCPDNVLLALCAEFHRRHTALGEISAEDEAAQDAAWAARQEVMDRIMGMRPTMVAARRAKAAVGVAVLLETPNWERNTEWRFALASFRAEAGA